MTNPQEQTQFYYLNVHDWSFVFIILTNNDIVHWAKPATNSHDKVVFDKEMNRVSASVISFGKQPANNCVLQEKILCSWFQSSFINHVKKQLSVH